VAGLPDAADADAAISDYNELSARLGQLSRPSALKTWGQVRAPEGLRSPPMPKYPTGLGRPALRTALHCSALPPLPQAWIVLKAQPPALPSLRVQLVKGTLVSIKCGIVATLRFLWTFPARVQVCWEVKYEWRSSSSNTCVHLCARAGRPC